MNNITIGQFIAFLSFIGMIVWPMRQLGRIVGDFGKTSVALDRLDEIVLKDSEHKDDSENEPKIEGAVEFKNVGFKFEDDDKPLLKNISFRVNKGESVAIVGKTGSGKSTLINLMIRLLDCDEGSIMFDGNDIKDINKKHLRKNVGIIMQEPFLYSRTLYDNIGIMNQEATEENVYKAASIAALHDDILGFESGYKTIVGERGVTLSGGQKQRIAIARALAVKPSLIVCDEPTSALDVSVQAQILNLLKELQDSLGVSFLFVTHNIGVVAYLADKVAVMHEGEIVEIGDTSQILNSPQATYTKTLLSAVPQLNQTLA